MTKAKYGPITQIGTVVHDLDESIRSWIETTGVGPWTVFRNVTLNGRYLGRDTVVKMDVGLAYQGEMQIELIHVTNKAQCPYLDAAGEPLAGLHHLAWMIDDLDAAVASAVSDGMELVFAAASPGTRVAYLKGMAEDGVLYEFIESESTRQLIADGIAATRNWDGTNPVQVIDFEA